MTRDVAIFNKSRNNLELNIQLELDMLKEEIQEFWDADTVAGRVDGYVDTDYVWIGTKIKYCYNVTDLPTALKSNVEMALELMSDYLKDELGEHYEEVITNARSIVCQANELKGKAKDENGKVIKDDKYREAIDATKRIALMIEEVTKPRSY